MLRLGTKLERHVLPAFFASDLVHDAVCTHCSLKATLQQAPDPVIPPKNGGTTAAKGPSLVHASGQGLSCVSQLSTEVGSGSAVESRGSLSGTGSVNSGPGRDATPLNRLERLQGLLGVSCPVPECDYNDLVRENGLDWVELRAPLLTRTVIARAPQVWHRTVKLSVLCPQAFVN